MIVFNILPDEKIQEINDLCETEKEIKHGVIVEINPHLSKELCHLIGEYGDSDGLMAFRHALRVRFSQRLAKLNEG